MKTISHSELEKIVAKGKITDIEGRKGYVSVEVDFGDNLVKNIAIKSENPKDARSQAAQVIIDEPEGIRGFKLKDSK